MSETGKIERRINQRGAAREVYDDVTHLVETLSKQQWCYDCYHGQNADYVVLCDRHAAVDTERARLERAVVEEAKEGVARNGLLPRLLVEAVKSLLQFEQERQPKV